MKANPRIVLFNLLTPLLICAFVARAGESPSAAEKMKTCFQCNGTGKMKCPACHDGEAACPEHCLKLTQGAWVHMQVAGHPDTDVWQKFEKPGGGWTAYNQGHVQKMRSVKTIDTGLRRD